MRKSVTGKYDRRVTLVYPDGTKVVDGIEVPNYVDGATIWVYIKPLKGKEFFQAQADQSELNVEIGFRYQKDRTGIKASWRIRYTSAGVNTVYEIQTPPVDVNMQHREIVTYCKVVE